MDKKWKKFERVVAAIHVAENTGAKVTWDDHINGRQFDVSMRFKFQFYDYLVLIECKDEQQHVKAEDVDAFVTKSRDTGANKAIIVSSSGFQSGAKKVAEKYNIELFTLTEIHNMPEGMLTDNIVSVLALLPVGFWKTGTREIIYLSTNPVERENEINNIPLIGMGPLKLIDILKPYSQLIAPFDIPGVPKFGGDFPVATKTRQNKAIQLQHGTKIRFPNTSAEIPVSHVLLSYWMQDARVIVPHSTPSIQYQYKNERTETTTTIDAEKLKLGFETKLEPGKFYIDPQTNYFYYCESIIKKGALLYLIYSYQNGQFVQGKAILPLSEANCFLEITDKQEIEKMKLLYQQVKDKDKQFANTPEAKAWAKDIAE
jgi:hypothetical protein